MPVHPLSPHLDSTVSGLIPQGSLCRTLLAPAVLGQQDGERDVDAARHVAAGDAGARLRRAEHAMTALETDYFQIKLLFKGTKSCENQRDVCFDREGYIK